MQTGQRQSIPKALDNEMAQPEQERYRNINDDAKRVLHAMVLLQLIGIRTSVAARVQAVATALFDLPDGRWDDACRDLVVAGDITQTALGTPSTPEGTPEARQSASLTFTGTGELMREAIADMLSGGQELPALWARLQQALMHWHDAEALVALGSSFNAYPFGDPHANQEHAIACYRAVLRIFRHDSAPIAWAITQNSLGKALATLAEFVPETERAHLLREAVTAFDAALEVTTRAADPGNWAIIVSNLGNALRQLALAARIAGEPLEAADLLQEAMGYLRAALEVRTPDTMLAEWAETQNNLGNALLAAADLTDGTKEGKKERQRLLREAVALYRQVLGTCDIDKMPGLWAATQNNLGSALSQEAATVTGETRRKRLAEATNAYRAALTVHTRDRMPLDWAMAQYNLGVVLHSQAEIAPDNAQPEILTQAVEAFTAALAVYTPQSAPADCAQIHFRLALLQRAQAALQTRSHSALTTLEAAQRNAGSAQTLFHAIGDDVRSHAASALSQQIEADLEHRSGGTQVRALMVRGQELNAQEHYTEALPHFEEAVQRAPGQFNAWYGLAYALGNLKRYVEALEAFRRAGALDPDDADAWYNQGLALNNLDRYQEALEPLERALALNPKYADAWCELAKALSALERHEEALAACERAITQRPAFGLALLRKGNELNSLGRQEESLSAYDAVIALTSEEASLRSCAYENRGRTLQTLGHLSEALAAIDQAIALDPHNEWAWNAKGYVYLDRKEYGEAMRCIDQAIALAPKEAAFWDSRGEIYMALQQVDEALSNFNHAIELSTQAGFAWRNKAKALRALGREAEADEAARRAKELGFA